VDRQLRGNGLISRFRKDRRAPSRGFSVVSRNNQGLVTSCFSTTFEFWFLRQTPSPFLRSSFLHSYSSLHPYSSRSVDTGSTRVARYAGMILAIKLTAISISDTAANVAK